MNTPKPDTERYDASLLDAFRKLPTSAICDAMHALSIPEAVMNPGVRQVSGTPFIGWARTVDRSSGARNARQDKFSHDLLLGTQIVIDSLSPDEVLVVAIGEDVSGAVIGSNMAARAGLRGAAGMVTDGAVRDLDALRDMGMAVVAKGSSPRVNFTHIVTKSIDQPTICGGVLVCPGDLIKSDGDGVVVISRDSAEKVLAKAIAIENTEEAMLAEIKGGMPLVDAIRQFKQR